MWASWTFTQVTVLRFHWLQHRETPASDIQYRLDQERRLRMATDERETVLPQVEEWSLTQCFTAFLEMKKKEMHVWKEPLSRSLSSLPSTARRRTSAPGGPARKPGAARAPESRRALASGAGAAAARAAPLQTQHRHLLHEAQVHPYALEARAQRQPLRGEPGPPGGESRALRWSSWSVCQLNIIALDFVELFAGSEYSWWSQLKSQHPTWPGWGVSWGLSVWSLSFF